MNLNLIKFNNIKQNSQYNQTQGVGRNDFQPSKDISFKSANVEKVVKGVGEVSYANIKVVAKEIDKILGDSFFTTTLKKADLIPVDDRIVFIEKNIFQEIASTITYPFFKLPKDLLNTFFRGLKKIPFLKKFATSALKIPPLARRAAEVEAQKNYDCIKALLTGFTKDEAILTTTRQGEKFSQFSKKNVKSTTYNLDICLEMFKDKAATDIVDLAKNYSSRDERTLNRLATSFVSALYSGRDFYNISMLQKDNKKEAKKAEHARLKQEFTRMGMSAATTFVSLGALSKYTKNNVLLNSLVIAGSALLSEIGSRILSNTPLKPLSSQEAKEYLQMEERKRFTSLLDWNNDTETFDKFLNNTEPPSFKGSFDNSNFKDFINKNNKKADSNLVSSNNQTDINDDIKNKKDDNKKTKQKPKRKPSALLLAIKLVSLTSIFYLAKKGLSGEYARKIANKNIYREQYKNIDAIISIGKKLPEGTLKDTLVEASNIRDKNPLYKFLRMLSDLAENIDYKKTQVSAASIERRIKELEQLPEGKQIKPLLDEYIRQAKDIETQEVENVITIFTKREFAGGVRRGVNKLLTTVYSILSMPAEIIDNVVNKIYFEESEKAIENLFNSGKGDICINLKARKGLSQLCQFIFENQKEGKKINTFAKQFKSNQRNDVQIIDAIKENTRNFEIGSDTGALANMSRTMVTAITSYFFVNDYRNKVLIESGGKDMENANEEGRQRVAHKLSNFVINGTLMNIFNSVFKRALNSSLTGAMTVAAATEITNEFMVRKSICQPIRHMKSKQDIIDYEKRQEDRKGFAGAWTRVFRKITGKKNLTEKVQGENKK